VDKPGPETIGAMGDGLAAMVAMSRATWVALVVDVGSWAVSSTMWAAVTVTWVALAA
jgi:hypothetical protein